MMAPSLVSDPPIPDFVTPKIKGDASSISPDSETVAMESFPVPPPAVSRLVHDVIKDQAVARPDAPAICSESVYLTYNALDQCSSRLATHISNYGIKPNSIVPIISDKVSKLLNILETMPRALKTGVACQLHPMTEVMLI